MKRFAALCTALLGIALLLTACAPQENTVSDEPLQQRAEAARSELPFAVGRLYDLSWADCFSSLTGCSDGKAFYTLEQSSLTEDPNGAQESTWLILRIDYATGVQSPLCRLPNCTHESADCPALLRGDRYNDSFLLTVAEGQLYVLHTFENEAFEQAGSASQQPTVWLDRTDNGSSRRRVAELPAGWMLEEDFPVTDGAALYGRYADLSDHSVHGVRVALETGEITSFSFGLDACENLAGALEGQFIMRRSDQDILQFAYPSVMAMERYSVFDSKGIEPYYLRSLVLYDPAAGTRTDLTGCLVPELTNGGYYSFLQQGKMYYITSEGIYDPQSVFQVDLAVGTQRILAQFAPPPSSGVSLRSLDRLRLFPAGPDTLEPYVLGSYWNGYNRYFLLDVRDGSVSEIGLQFTIYSGEGQGSGSYPVAQTSSGLWLVPVNYTVDPWGNQRWSYGLAAPETVLSGEGEVYPIQMWAPDEPLG